MAVRTARQATVTRQWTNGTEHTEVLYPETCCNCGVVFAMTKALQDIRRSDGAWFYCPNGHKQHYTETDAARLRKEKEKAKLAADRAERLLDNAIDNANFERNRARALKGHLTRARNRAAAGVCPAAGCKRSFHSLAEHVRTEHPDLIETLPDGR